MKTLITKNWNNDKHRVDLVIQEITTTVFVKIPDSKGMFWNDQIFTESGENALIKALERAEKYYNIKLIGE